MALDLDYKDTRILTDIYSELDIKTIQDIVKRISKMGDLSLLNEFQLKAIKEKNRKDIFNKTLEEVGFLTAYMNGATKKIYNNYAHHIVKKNKKLYQYRDKQSKLNETQIDMLNSGLKETQNLIKNFTGTIAYASENTYVEAVDKAYLDVLSGEKTYDKAIYETYKNLAQKGVKLTDSLGRNVQLETAVERNLRMGLQSTADRISDSIFTELGCDGYEVSAHSGARPTHAIAQGKQYALTREDARKYGVGYWYDTVDGEPIAELWHDYNCRHSYWPIILEVSKSNYTKKEIRQMRTQTVNYKGQKISLYEATQRQHYFESQIRNTKRAIESLGNSNDSNVLKAKSSLENTLKNYQTKYRDFNNATGLSPDYTRTRI
jgi:hypothetical protein